MKYDLPSTHPKLQNFIHFFLSSRSEAIHFQAALAGTQTAHASSVRKVDSP